MRSSSLCISATFHYFFLRSYKREQTIKFSQGAWLCKKSQLCFKEATTTSSQQVRKLFSFLFSSILTSVNTESFMFFFQHLSRSKAFQCTARSVISVTRVILQFNFLWIYLHRIIGRDFNKRMSICVCNVSEVNLR